ncbi:acyl-CoA dehydrogenase [Variovorax guangxiensis]|uniref:acyl-CoA dehydrogenase n=1 Tax=Variovorax guangxiensis TaxID=1775474 RepID=UPI00286BB5B4|nr:acyl-CoA dehydrogenase [Variovorax guangxiensis]
MDNGFTNLLSPEEHGGAGIGWSDAFPLFWGIGYYRVPLPIAETVIANFILNSAGIDAGTTEPIAFADEVAAAKLVVRDSPEGVVLKGAVARVHWARAAEKVLVALPDGRLGLWKLNSPAISILERTDVTKLPSDTVVFEDAAADVVFDCPFANVELPLRHFGAIARSAMMVGAAEFALEESVQYALDRVQFGKPIGKNQALQQQLAHMAGQIAVARHAATLAFLHVPSWSDSHASGDAISAACAKVLAGEAADVSTTVAHQVHGALGFTYEHILNFATRRLWAWREDHGTASWWARRIGGTVARQGGDAFWPAMTDPKLYGGSTAA